MSTYYVSGPMTGIPEFNFPMFDSCVAAIDGRTGDHAISPAAHDREVAASYGHPDITLVPGYAEGDVALYTKSLGHAVENFLVWDFIQIATEADGIALLPGWERSSGAKHELYVAEALKREVWTAHTSAGARWGDWYFTRQAPGLLARALGAELAPERQYTLHDVELDTVGHIGARAENDLIPQTAADVLGDVLAQLHGETRIVDPITGGAKGRKLARWDLIPPDAMLTVAEHYGRGAMKYEDRNWEKGYAWGLSASSLQNHHNAWLRGETFDPEGFRHATAVAWHALALLTFELRGLGTDDRPKMGGS